MELRNDRLHRCFKVAKFQIGKAIKALNEESCFQALKPSACTCRNQCPSKFTYSEICAVRERLYTQESEQAKTTWLSQHLRDNNQKCTIAGKQVCVLFFCKALMISDYKLRLARKFSASPVNALSPVPRQPLRPDARTPEKKLLCVSFWQQFFDQCSQTSQDGELYFPVNLGMRAIYLQYFYPWCEKGNHFPPSRSVFSRARNQFTHLSAGRTIFTPDVLLARPLIKITWQPFARTAACPLNFAKSAQLIMPVSLHGVVWKHICRPELPTTPRRY